MKFQAPLIALTPQLVSLHHILLGNVRDLNASDFRRGRPIATAKSVDGVLCFLAPALPLDPHAPLRQAVTPSINAAAIHT